MQHSIELIQNIFPSPKENYHSKTVKNLSTNPTPKPNLPPKPNPFATPLTHQTATRAIALPNRSQFPRPELSQRISIKRAHRELSARQAPHVSPSSQAQANLSPGPLRDEVMSPEPHNWCGDRPHRLFLVHRSLLPSRSVDHVCAHVQLEKRCGLF